MTKIKSLGGQKSLALRHGALNFGQADLDRFA